MVTLEHHDRPVQFGHVQTQVVRPDLFISRVGENLRMFQESETSPGERASVYPPLPCPARRYLVASHAVAVENTHFLVLLTGHVVQALVGLHVTDLERNHRGSQQSLGSP